jgi:hypothetical protein
MKWVALSAEGEKSMPLFAMIPTGKPWTCANPYIGASCPKIRKFSAGILGERRKGQTVTMVCPYSFLNSRKRLPSTNRAITSRMSNGWRRSVPTIPCSSFAG